MAVALPAVFPLLPAGALERMNGEKRRWTDACDAALALPTEEERWLELGRVFLEASELTGAATERLAEEEGVAADERALSTVICADGSRVYLVNGLALYVVGAPLEGASVAYGEAACTRRRMFMEELRMAAQVWTALLRAPLSANTPHLTLPLLLTANFRGMTVVACAVSPPSDVGGGGGGGGGGVAEGSVLSNTPTEAQLIAATAPLADAPPVLRSLSSNASLFSTTQAPHRILLTGALRELLPRDSLWSTLTPLPAVLIPASTSHAMSVEMIPRIGWAEALEALLGAQHEAWHFPSSPHSLFYHASPAPPNPRATKLYLGAGVKGAPAELRGTVLFVPRFRESACLVRPELGLASSASAAEVSAALEGKLTALVQRLNTDAPMWPWQLAAVLHSFGVSLRYLGIVRQRVKEPRVKRLLLVEGTVRALKSRLAERQARRSMQTSNTVLLHFLNAVFGDGPPSERLWRTHLPQRIAWKYPGMLETTTQTDDLRAMLTHHRLPLLRGLQRAIGIRLNDAIEARLLEASSLRLTGSVVGLGDIKSVVPLVCAPVLPRAELLAARLALPSEEVATRHNMPQIERKPSAMDPQLLAQRQEEEAAGWVFVERNSARRSTRPKAPAAPAAAAVPKAPEAKGAADNCTIS